MDLNNAYLLNTCDAVIVGSGPNGLSAGIALAQEGYKVVILEAKATIGGGLRSMPLTLPGFKHDVCSAIHPLGISSPFFKTLPLEEHGLQWIQPSFPLAHPLDEGKAILLHRSVDETAKYLEKDEDAYKKLMMPFVIEWDRLSEDLLAPFHFPYHPILTTRFGILGIRSALGLIKAKFKAPYAKSLFSGLAAHAIMPLEEPLTAAFGIILGVLGHKVGWPLPKGGSQSLADALGSIFKALGGILITDTIIQFIDQLPKDKPILFDLSPKQVLNIANNRFSVSYKRKLEKYHYGPGVFKIDWALNNPIPWRSEECARAGTVHIGGTWEEIAASERQVGKGEHPERPFIILAQPSLFDNTRAPWPKQTAWGYCHVPNGSNVDMTEKIERQIERFAPGFRDSILARSTKTAVEMEKYNPNYIGGDINGGTQNINQLFSRPAYLFCPYFTRSEGIYLCSSSTPPGGGVHGLCGYFAAKEVMKHYFK